MPGSRPREEVDVERMLVPALREEWVAVNGQPTYVLKIGDIQADLPLVVILPGTRTQTRTPPSNTYLQTRLHTHHAGRFTTDGHPTRYTHTHIHVHARTRVQADLLLIVIVPGAHTHRWYTHVDAYLHMSTHKHTHTHAPTQIHVVRQ